MAGEKLTTLRIHLKNGALLQVDAVTDWLLDRYSDGTIREFKWVQEVASARGLLKTVALGEIVAIEEVRR